MKVSVKMPSGLNRAAQQATKRALTALASVARDKMTQLANEKLKTTARIYTNAISIPTQGDKTIVLELSSQLASMMEKGTPPFDIKKMLKGRAWVDVPFRIKKGSKGVAAKKGTTHYISPRSAWMPIKRVTHVYAKAEQATSWVFRRISKNSPASSWIHPGFKPLGIFPVVAKEIRKLAPKVIADYIKEGIR